MSVTSNILDPDRGQGERQSTERGRRRLVARERPHWAVGEWPARVAEFAHLPLGARFRLIKDSDRVYQKTTRHAFAGPARKRRQAPPGMFLYPA